MQYIQLTPTIHILSQPLPRKKLEMEIVYSSGGSWFEEAGDRGKKHLLEHCIVSRTKDMDYTTFKNYQFQENINVNAYTGPLTMGLSASGHYSDFYKITDLLLETALEPTFDQAILDQEKEIVLREISERRGEPNYRLHYATTNQIFTSDSYENHEVLGDSQLVAQTTLADFHKLHTQNLEKSHLFINLSGGGLDIDYIQAKLLEYVARNPVLSQDKLKNPINFSATSKFQNFNYLPITHELAHSQAELSIYIPCPISFANKPHLKIFDELFLKYYGVLYDELRDKLGLIYSMQSSFSFELQSLGIYLTCEIEHIQAILAHIKKVFGDLEHYFSSQKFGQFKNLIKKKMEISQDSLGSGPNFTQGMMQTYGMPEIFEEYEKRLDSVGQEDVKTIYKNIQTGIENWKVIAISKEKISFE